MCDVGQKQYTIQGVKVLFPYRAYPSQLAMMDRMLKGLKARTNCLLESPTGSGKSCALLCASLAWQNSERDRIMLMQMAELLDTKSCLASTPKIQAANHTSPKTKCISPAATKNQSPQSPVWETCHDDDDDFRPLKRKKVASMSESPSPSKQEVTEPGPSACSESSKAATSQSEKDIDAKRLVLPKIFFGTRTHKQIAQIVRELGRTAYKDTKMVILSSREKTCIHPVVSNSDGKNEKCRELLDHPNGPQCPHFQNVYKVSQNSLPYLGVPSPWNIEDLVKVGKSIRACPYFSLRDLMTNADIVFCPYNYLIDPLIRDAMDISLKNNIVILDEAHNIEDSAREAASWQATQDDLTEAAFDLESQAYADPASSESFQAVAKLLSGIAHWVATNSDHLDGFQEFDRSGKIWSGTEFVAKLKDLKAGPEHRQRLRKVFRDIVSPDSRDPETNQPSLVLQSSTVMLVKGLQNTLRYLYSNELKHMPDYKVAIIRTMARRPKPSRLSSGWLSTTEHSPWRNTLHVWCLSPSVAFSDFKHCVHSLVVTSGTLSPMKSFQSELEMPFAIQLEASHVIHSSQVWIGTVGKGPQEVALNGSFKCSETFQFQDEIGSALLQICGVVPHGVLCFVPSYSMLDKLTQRWHQTGLWERLECLKVVVCEPRSSDGADMEAAMGAFYSAVQDSKHGEGGGALLMAVFRGKVSEGLDFADENARAVVTVGIPFPNVKDIQVKLKREYNSRHASQRSLMPGNEWYETQAFRALNQALGRCIRHRDDWGALFLLDERFQQKQKNVESLSKWVRNGLRHHRTFVDAIASLRDFMDAKR